MGRIGRVFQGLVVFCFLSTSTFAGSDVDAVVSALERQSEWLATSDQGSGWNEFLLTGMLREQLRKQPADIDRREVAQVLGRYTSDTPGLDHPIFTKTRKALARWADTSQVPMAPRWAERLRASAETTTPIRAATIQRAHNQLQDATDALGEMLRTADEDTERGWKTFLRWDDLHEQLQMGTPHWKTLETVALQFFNGHPGLEFPEFVRVRDALRKYLYLGTMGSNGVGQTNIRTQMRSLAEALDKYNESSTTKNAAEVAALLDWLDQLERVPVLAPTIRGAHLLPNIKIRVSEGLLARRFGQEVDEPSRVSEMILGTHVRGIAQTRGTITADIVESSEVARIDIVFRGRAHTNSTGRQKPVTIRSTSTTALEARKSLYVFPKRVTSDPAVARGQTSTTIHSITPDRNLGRRFIEKLAWKRAMGQKSQAERIASARSARRLEQRIDSRSQELLTRAQQTLREQLRGPINRRGLIPEKIRTLSKDDHALVLATQAGKAQFAATTTPPMFCPGDDVVAQVHESAINNTFEKAIAGLTLTDERIAELTEEVTGSTPEELQISEDDEPWSISFAWQLPVTVEFLDQTMRIAVRGRQFTSGERVLNRVMEMSAVYSMETTPIGVRLVRQGEVEVTFPGIPEGQRLRATDLLFKTLMQKKFTELFKPEIQGEGFSLPGRFEELGRIRLKDLSAEGGWLSLGWK